MVEVNAYTLLREDQELNTFCGRNAQDGKLIGWMLRPYLYTSLAGRSPGFYAMWLIAMVHSGVLWLRFPEQVEVDW